MKLIVISIACLLTVGCATADNVTYQVESIPKDAPVDINGVSIGKTPTTATLECRRRWVGLMNSPDGWENASGPYEIKAFPPKGTKAESQTKHVDPCQWKGRANPTIHFDLGLEHIAPKQRLELNATIKSEYSDIQESLDALKTLRNTGVITEEEYKAKLLELVK